MSDVRELIYDGTDEDLDARARHLALVTPFSYEDARDAIEKFTAAVSSIVRAASESANALMGLMAELDAPRRRTSMHAAYRAKTRRRNRR